MEKINILYTADINYFNHMLTSLYSLAINHLNDDVLIHIIGDGYTKDQLLELIKFRKKFSNIEFKFYSIDKLSKQMKTFNIPSYNGSYMPNARLFAREIIKDTEKILYLDSDTIISSSLKDIFSIDAKAPISLVKEHSIPYYMRDKVIEYYNSGVLLFDFKEWDKEDYYKKMYEVIKNEDNFLYPDQDLINIVFAGNINALDYSYNISPYIYNIMKYRNLAKRTIMNLRSFYSYEEIIEAINRPHIYHMLSFFGRPWNKNKVHPYNDLYDSYRLLWDKEYEKTDSDSLYSNIIITSFLEALASGLFTYEGYASIKENMKKLVQK